MDFSGPKINFWDPKIDLWDPKYQFLNPKSIFGLQKLIIGFQKLFFWFKIDFWGSKNQFLNPKNWFLDSKHWFFGSNWFLEVPIEIPSPNKCFLGLLGMLEVPDWGFAPWSWFGYGQWSFEHPFSKFWFSILEDPRGSWPGFGILILIWIWSLVFDIPMIRILDLYLDFEGAKNIHVP